MIYISYYTKNTPYEKVMYTRLIPSLQKFSLKHDIEAIEDRGNWQANTHYKAEFIKKMLLKHKEAVVFLDSDATIEKYPALFTQMTDYDISYHELDWNLQWRGYPGEKREILSGTLYLNYNEKVLRFLDDWIDENNRSIQWEQKNMAKVLEKWKNRLQIYPLPPEYITIILFNGKVPKHIEDPVIIHWQASRQFKRK